MDNASYTRAKEQLRGASESYYRDGTSAMDDASYDALLREVAEYEQSEGITSDVAGEAIGAGANLAGTVRHTVPMLSLDNVFDRASLDRWMDTLGDDPTVVVEPKLDGLAMSIHYTDGRPTRMLTRGDGRTGEDVSKALGLIDNLPTNVLTAPDALVRGMFPFTGEVRGEVIFSAEQFEAADAARVAAGGTSFANARNAAAGTVNRASKGGAVPAGTHLSFVVYDWTDAATKWSNHVEAMHALAKAGFTVAVDLLTGPVTLDNKPAVDFDIDGLVYKVNDFAERDELGTTSRAPRWARAFKYPPDTAHTTLVDVLWQVGRTGSVTPRAVLSPVKVGGTLVTYATLHNPGELRRKGVRLGDTVEVRRAAEVIPEVVGVAAGTDTGHTDIPVPTHCPNCGEPLDDSQARLRCPSGGECAAERKLAYATSRDALDIEGMSTSMVEALIAAGRLKTVADIFDLTQSAIATCPTGRTTTNGNPVAIGDAVATKVMAEVERARTEATFERVLTSLGITGTGRSLSKRLAQHFGSMTALLSATPDDLAEVDKMGPVKAGQVYRQLQSPDMLATITRLTDHGLAMEVESNDGPQPLAGLTIVVTGPMRHLGSRSEVTGNLEALGATVGSSVSAKTSLVVADDPDGTSSKLVKARKLGVRIVDEDTFRAEFGI